MMVVAIDLIFSIQSHSAVVILTKNFGYTDTVNDMVLQTK